MNDYLLDTCFILGLFNENAKTLKIMQNISPKNCFVSVINRIELLGYHGITTHDEMMLNDFLNEITQLDLSQKTANKAIEIRKRHKIKLADSIVLAAALVHDLTLLTLDEKLAKHYHQEIASR
ncbi:MAG: type II toxin-antitoxin system VapC family toxin [Moraxella sp.]|nr:type II toxin-antitoxin system VapC family toxin [Moraxella sp.]